jgi:uncharacterized protein (TIGR02391 family)
MCNNGPALKPTPETRVGAALTEWINLDALKELNDKVKAYARSTGKLSFDKGELDGASLMFAAFGGTPPPIVLADLSTESGRNIQDGYAKIFAGAMTGIRNQKAHANLQIDAERAIHLLYLASLLHQVFDERPKS